MALRENILFGWIEACIRYGGVFGPAEKVTYQEVFGFSEGSVSRHQAKFEILFEKTCGAVFDRDSEGRVRGGRLALNEDAKIPQDPVFESMPDLKRWLHDNFGGSGYFEEEIRHREPDPWIMRPIIRSIRSRTPLLILYHSRSRQAERIVSPHAIIRIAGRMHMRAYDHSNNEHRDFVLTRITRAALIANGAEYVGADQDASWARIRHVVIEDKGLPSGEKSRRGIQLDFGLDGSGRRIVRVREPLVQYLIDEMNEGYSTPVRVFENLRNDS
jgi:hypothetical protein